MYTMVPFNILWSIGQAGRNKPPDVAAAQVLLNLAGKPGIPALPVDGKFGPATLQPLQTFQTKHMGLSRAVANVDPGSATIEP